MITFNGKEVEAGHLVKIEFGGLVSPDWLVVNKHPERLYDWYVQPIRGVKKVYHLDEVTITDHLIPGAFRLLDGDYWNLAVGVDPDDFSTPVEVDPEYVTVADGQDLMGTVFGIRDVEDLSVPDTFVLTPEASARILADPSWHPETRDVKVGDRVRDDGGNLAVVTDFAEGPYFRVRWDAEGFDRRQNYRYHPSQFSLVAKEDAAYKAPEPEPEPHKFKVGDRVILNADEARFASGTRSLYQPGRGGAGKIIMLVGDGNVSVEWDDIPDGSGCCDPRHTTEGGHMSTTEPTREETVEVLANAMPWDNAIPSANRMINFLRSPEGETHLRALASEILAGAEERVEKAEATLADLTSRLGFGDGITEPQADNDTIVKSAAEDRMWAGDYAEALQRAERAEAALAAEQAKVERASSVLGNVRRGVYRARYNCECQVGGVDAMSIDTDWLTYWLDEVAKFLAANSATEGKDEGQ